jgi:RNA polymerase sigma factor (sigma-70 family)
VSTAHDLPYGYAEPDTLAPNALRLVPTDPLDFDDAVRRVRPRLHRYAIRRLGDVHEAEELVQEALLRAYSHREQLLTEDDLSAWTTVVTGRLVIDRLRVRGRSTSYADVPETGRLGRDTADIVVGRDEARTALDALDAMPPRQASLLWAREVEGQSYEELCARFGMTEPAVRSVLTRARKALRKEYETRGGTLPVGGLAILAPWLAGMSWADKLRAAVGRITAPAALATAGITVLGGLIVSPFGATFAHTPGEFAPSTAVVRSSVASTMYDAPLHGVAVQNSPTRPTTVPSRRTNVNAKTKPYGALDSGLVHVEQVPCDNVKDLPVDSQRVPGLGGSHCRTGTTVIRVPIPVANPTGYDALSITSSDVGCAPFTPATNTGRVQCSTQENHS